jgi:uracil-DNA glycosylase family 4
MIPAEAEMALGLLHDRINSCHLCSTVVPNFVKPLTMNRGEAGSIVVVGQGPGNTEIAKEQAFSGYSGKRLDEWLIQCGATKERPRAGIYMTSVIKCIGAKNAFPKMAHNCRPFLNQQLSIIRPALVITLGQQAYEELRFNQAPYQAALCQEYRSADYVMMTPVGFHYSLLPWPHPSGLNRWHNDQENIDLLTASFQTVRAHLVKQ